MAALRWVVFTLCVVTLYYVLPYIATTFHEFGHFFIAKAFGVDVLSYTVGKGDVLFSFTWLDTNFFFHQSVGGGVVRHRVTESLVCDALIGVAGPIAGIYFLLMTLFATLRIMRYPLAFGRFIAQAHLLLFKMCFYLLTPWLFFKHVKVNLANPKGVVRLSAFMINEDKKRYIFIFNLILCCFLGHLANLTPGVLGAQSDGTRVIFKVLEMFSISASIESVAVYSLLVLQLTLIYALVAWIVVCIQHFYIAKRPL
tara:strand:- start:21863 stop:22627 length:765 start_codon:yes stop_codon:yes gene_type:complete